MRYDEDDINYEPEWGLKIGPEMKGVLIDGEVLAWTVNKQGKPHHDDIDADSKRTLEFAHMDQFIGVSGYGPPIQFVSDLLSWFTDYKNDTDIEVDVELQGTEIRLHFFGTVGALKTFFKSHPPPDVNDYEDEKDDVDFLRDYIEWVELPLQKKSVREILGRGGREDNWQHEDADTSRSFSVYNPKRKKVRKKSR